MSEFSEILEGFRQQRIETVNRLAAGVAHEFNNSLQIVQGYVTFARNSLPTDSQTRGDLDIALEATERAAGLASQLLIFARAEDHFDADDAVDANEVLESLRLLLRPIVGEDVRVHCEMADDLPFAAAREALLRQALLNLCINARDAMPDGGDLWVETALETPGPSAVAAVGELEPCEYVRVSVADSGEGMPAEVEQHIFEPFYSTKAPRKGTGLGLSMVAAFVEASGGAVVVTTGSGRGARFDLYFRPRAAVEMVEDEAVAIGGDAEF